MDELRRPVAAQMHTYDTCQDMRTHATICSPKQEAKKRALTQWHFGPLKS